MSLFDILAYCAALIPFAVSPGPLMAIVIARCVGGDTRGALGFVVGMTFGYVALLTIVTMGVGSWLQSIPTLVQLIKYAALGYFCWIAYGIWTNASGVGGTEPTARNDWQSVSAGLLTSLASPHVVLFFIIITPQIINIDEVSMVEFSTAALTTMIALLSSFCLLIYLATRFGAMAVNGPVGIWVNRALACVIALAGLMLATA